MNDEDSVGIGGQVNELRQVVDGSRDLFQPLDELIVVESDVQDSLRLIGWNLNVVGLVYKVLTDNLRARELNPENLILILSFGNRDLNRGDCVGPFGYGWCGCPQGYRGIGLTLSLSLSLGLVSG